MGIKTHITTISNDNEPPMCQYFPVKYHQHQSWKNLLYDQRQRRYFFLATFSSLTPYHMNPTSHIPPSPPQYPPSRLRLRLLLFLLLSRLRLRLFFFACAFPVSAPMTAPPSVPTPGPSSTSPMMPPAPAPRKLSRDSCDFFLEWVWWWWWCFLCGWLSS